MRPNRVLVGVIIGIVLGGLGGYIAAPKPDVASLNQRIDELELEITDHQSRISVLQEQNEGYARNATELNEQITELQEFVIIKDALIDTKEFEITTLYNRISELEDEISYLEAEYEQLSFSSNITFVATSFSRLDDTASILEHWIGRANHTIRLMVMLITHNELADALIAAHNRGVDIEIVIDSNWESSSGSDFDELLSSGIDIRGDERSGLMHHKAMVIDGYVIITGSYNWSASAEDSNDENILVLKSRMISQIYLSEFDRIWSQTSS